MNDNLPEITDDHDDITEAAKILIYYAWWKEEPITVTLTDVKVGDVIIGDYIVSVKKK